MDAFASRRAELYTDYERLVRRPNAPALPGNGIYRKYLNPVLTAGHAPLHWRYDLDPVRNPRLMERIAVNTVFNPGAIEMDGKICLVARVEGADRKSFFAVAESESGVDNFRFRDRPIVMPSTDNPDTNIYDMRLTRHEDGWIYGLFCSERRDPAAAPGDLSAAVAQCGIARTRDLDKWERLPDLVTGSAQQRNVVLHPEFVDGQYAFYTRPQDGFIDAGGGGGIGFGLSRAIEGARVDKEDIIDGRAYHTIKESKNGAGCVPIRTPEGWLHIAHGVRGGSAGLRYVIYAFMTELERPWVARYAPGGGLIVPKGAERVGDTSNVVFTNGAVARGDELFIYYASSDTRCHVAKSSVEAMVDYCKNTPPDPLTTAGSVAQRMALIDANQGRY